MSTDDGGLGSLTFVSWTVYIHKPGVVLYQHRGCAGGDMEGRVDAADREGAAVVPFNHVVKLENLCQFLSFRRVPVVLPR